MPDVYLRVSAVNLADSVYDTNDISTIRGGGFMLLEAVNRMAEAAELAPYLEKISVGASTGIFRLTDAGAADAARVKEETWKFLAATVGGGNGSAFDGHATFTVDVLEGKGATFQEIQERLTAENRWRQLQQLTVSFGDGWKGAEKPCYHNGVRPGLSKEPDPDTDKNRPVSGSALFRRREGRPLRQKIYRKVLGEAGGDLPNFTDNLEELSTRPPKGVSKNLDGKIAFIYVDGNKFGAIREEHCTDADSLTAFDKAVQERFRAAVLQTVIDNMAADPAGHITTNGRTALRLETLLWGGDEIEWVVPAWKGWEILRLFYAFDPPPSFDGSSAPGAAGRKIPLTHAAGIVFCKHSAPILQIRKLARRLADLAKERLTGVPRGRAEGDIFHYLALDSFDMVGGDVGRFLACHYRPFDFGTLLMAGPKMAGFSADLSKLKADFPRRKLHDIIGALQCQLPVNPILKSGMSFCPPDRRGELETAVAGLVGDDPARWFTVADLWDFA